MRGYRSALWIESIKFLRERGAESVTCVCLIAAPEGIAALEKGIEGYGEC